MFEPEFISNLLSCTCAIGFVTVPLEEFYADTIGL